MDCEGAEFGLKKVVEAVNIGDEKKEMPSESGRAGSPTSRVVEKNKWKHVAEVIDTYQQLSSLAFRNVCR